MHPALSKLVDVAIGSLNDNSEALSKRMKHITANGKFIKEMIYIALVLLFNYILILTIRYYSLKYLNCR